MVGTLFFKKKRSVPFKIDSSGYRLQFKPDCFYRAGDAGSVDGWISVTLKYAGDNEDFLYSKAQSFGWDLVSRHTNYEEQTDEFVIETQSNGEMRALEQLTESLGSCAQRALKQVQDRPNCKLEKFR